MTDRWGDQIVLTEEDWDRIVAKRLEIAPYRDEIQQTLEKPNAVWEGGWVDTKVFYAKDLVTDHPFRGCYVAVAVRYTSKPASIRTAYLSINMAANLGKLLHFDR